VKNSHLNDMVEIVLTKPDNFLILKETLTRIGVPNKDNTKLYQTCHILCKKKKYYIVHFKEMFMLDGRPSSMAETDTARRNSVINYLLDRKFFTLANGETKLEPFLPHTSKNDDFTIITHAQKKKWELVPKYVIGNPANKTKKKVKVVAAEVAVLTAAEPVLS
jgi:Bacteriophage translational regulator